jgi:FkbM family methyltransferase
MSQFGKYKTYDEIPDEEKKFYYAMDKFRPVESIEWVDILFNGIWPVRIPKFLHDYHSWWDFWEIHCHLSMQKHLQPGMILYDVGAFDGWQSAVFSQMVGGPENIVLIEPVPEMWSNTRETWRQNNLAPPRGAFVGFAGDYDKPSETFENMWPTGIDYSQMLKAIKFRLMHEHVDTPCLKIDSMPFPKADALHIDVEGAELKVLQGAEKLLREKKPLVWLAIHPEFMRDRFNTEELKLHQFMFDMGYRKGTHLATDHESHWFYE